MDSASRCIFRARLRATAAAFIFASCLNAQPQFRFAVLTDIQYADKAALRERDYRASIDKLRAATVAIEAAHPEFTIQLGDLVDGGEENLARILPLWSAVPAPRYSVLGNHDFCMLPDALVRKLGMPAAWYDFTTRAWRFVVLDGMDVSLPAHHPAAAGMLAALRARNAPNAQDWNGAIGQEQLRWLRRTLADARQRKQRVVVFCHFPILQEASTPQHLLWNADQVLSVITEFPNVATYMNGHDHKGGYAASAGVHHVTFPGMVESGAKNSYTLVDVYGDRLELRGFGTAPSRTLALKALPR